MPAGKETCNTRRNWHSCRRSGALRHCNITRVVAMEGRTAKNGTLPQGIAPGFACCLQGQKQPKQGEAARPCLASGCAMLSLQSSSTTTSGCAAPDACRADLMLSPTLCTSRERGDTCKKSSQGATHSSAYGTGSVRVPARNRGAGQPCIKAWCRALCGRRHVGPGCGTMGCRGWPTRGAGVPAQRPGGEHRETIA